MKIKRVRGNEEVDDDIKYMITVTPYTADETQYADTKHDIDIFVTGKELKRIAELINTFNQIQDNPAPISGFGDMLGILKKFGGK